MSAFLCDPYHVSALVSWAHANGVIAAHNGHRIDFADPIKCEVIGEILYEANVLAIATRYGQAAADSDSADIPWVFELLTDLPTPGTIANGCTCYDYQACEADSYAGSMAQAVVAAIKTAAECFPKSKRDQPWEIRPPQDPNAHRTTV